MLSRITSTLAGAIARSPIVTEDHVTTVFAGVVFRIH